MDQGNRSLSELHQERVEGSLTSDLDVLSLGMTDDEVQRAIGNRVNEAEKFWNSKLDLDKVREKAEKFWLSNYLSEADLYEYQAPYKDSRIFTAIETLVSLVASNPPQPLATQAYDTQASYELAQNLQKALLSKYEDLYLKSRFQLVARHLLIGHRLGVMKVRWDDTLGQLQPDGSRFGDMAVDALRAGRVVIDAGAQDKDNVPLIGEYRASTLEDLIDEYPEKSEDIIREAGKYKKGTTLDYSSQEGFVEVHFTTRDKKSKQRVEAIAWKYKTLLLGSTKTPFWNYDETYEDSEGKVKQANFLTRPQKPYILFNFLNLGRWVLDDTSLTDQAMALQEIHDKRGRQIVENADQANGGWVFNTMMVKAEDAAAWINNPGDKILSKGNVNEAVARFPAPALPDYVLQDKIDARNEIDNIFGTHGAIKGEVTDSKTLGQDVLSQRGDTARLNVLATAMEDGGDRLYKFMTQTMKVFYDEPQLIRYSASDSSTNFFSFGRDQIEAGTAIRVKQGSVLPEDPMAKKQDTKEMLPILDPLAIAEGLNVDDPKEWAKRNLMYRLFPDKYMTEVLGYIPGESNKDPMAIQHIQLLNKGEQVPPELNVTKEHLATHQAYLEDPQFITLSPEIQQLHKDHIQAELNNAKSAMGMTGQRPGMPEEGMQQPMIDSGVPQEPLQLPPGAEGQQGSAPQGTGIINQPQV